MEQRFTLDGNMGRMVVREENLRAQVSVERPDDGKGLYKAYIQGRGGRVMLGTMAPEGGMLRIRRTLSLDELRRRGAWPIQGGGAELSFSFRQESRPPAGWQWEEGDSLLLEEPALGRTVAQQGRVLCRRDGGRMTLAYPFETGREFPLPGLFCLARVEGFDGQPFALFSFDGNGRPIL